MMRRFASLRPETMSGMLLGAGAFGLLTAVDTVFKYLATEGHPPHQIIFFNAFPALVCILLWAARSGGVMRLRTAHPAQHLARGSAAVMAAFSAVYAYSHLTLASFYTIMFAGPLTVTMMSAFWLNEQVDKARWAAIVLGFSGIMIVANPFENDGTGAPDAGLMLGRLSAFISVFCYALSVIMVRRMRLRESSISFAFYGFISAFVIAGTLTLLRGAPAFTPSDLLCLALSGALAGISTICMMAAYHRTPVALVAPFQYTQIIWGSLTGYLIWHHIPTLRLVLGAAVVAASGFYVIRQEMRVPAVPKQAGQ